jgi:hypothetical protein
VDTQVVEGLRHLETRMAGNRNAPIAAMAADGPVSASFQTAPAVRPAEERPLITYSVERIDGLPKDDDLQKLVTVVLRRHPELEPQSERRDEFFRDFRSACNHIAGLPRTEKPNSKYALSWWLDYLQSARGSVVRGPPYIVAALAQGDVRLCAGKWRARARLGIWASSLRRPPRDPRSMAKGARGRVSSAFAV